MITLLPPERWPELEAIMAETFNAVLPDADKATIIADLDGDGGIRGFVIVDLMVRVGQIYSRGSSPRQMMSFIERGIRPGTTVIALADEPRFEGLCEKFGMREVPGKLFWLDK
jgi:hypothetical protein